MYGQRPPQLPPIGGQYSNPISAGRIAAPGPVRAQGQAPAMPGGMPQGAQSALQNQLNTMLAGNNARDTVGLSRAAAPAMASLESARQGAVEQAGLQNASFLGQRYQDLLGRNQQNQQLGFGDAQLASQRNRLNAGLGMGRLAQMGPLLQFLESISAGG